MKKQLISLLTTGILLGAASAQGGVTINFQTFANPIGGSTATLTATDGDVTTIVSSATLSQTGLTVEETGANVDLTAISSTYNDWISFNFATTTAVNVTETSFFYDFVNGNRDNRFTQVSVFVYDNLTDLNVLDSVTLAEVNTGNTDQATITSAAGAYSTLDSGTAFEVRFALRSSETWGDQDMDNLSVTLAVPEPSTYALLAGLLALGGVMLRRRR